MNPIQKALSDVKNKIPRAILDRTFMREDTNVYGGRHNFTPTSLDHRIRTNVIDAIVLPDCNLVGGTEITIPLASLVPHYVNTYNMVYRVPKNMTQNRSILRVLHMTFGDGGMVGSMGLATQGRSALLDAAQGALQAHLPIPVVSTANIELVAENTILVKDNVTLPGNPFLRCVIESDSEMNHLQPASIIAFSNLVVLATKRYIFNTLAIDMDQAQLSGGMALGRFREIVDGYSDADEQYTTFFNESWRKVAIFNDPSAYARHLKLLTGGRW